MENPDALGYPQAAAAPEIAPSGLKRRRTVTVRWLSACRLAPVA